MRQPTKQRASAQSRNCSFWVLKMSLRTLFLSLGAVVNTLVSDSLRQPRPISAPTSDEGISDHAKSISP